MPLRVNTRAGSHERRTRSLRCSGLGRECHGEVAVRGDTPGGAHPTQTTS